MLKGLVLALLLANLAFFAWTRGQTVRAEREPDRQAQQIRPESVRLLAPDGSAEAPPAEAASSATEAVASVDEAASAAATTLCIEAGPFSSTEVASAEAALAASPAASAVANRWTRVAAEAPDTAASAATAYRLRVDAATPDEAAALEALPASVLTRGFAACATR